MLKKLKLFFQHRLFLNFIKKEDETYINPWDKIKKNNFKNKRIIILTGAGISKESGLETFRENGIYDKNPELKYLLRPDTLEKDPKFIYDFHHSFKNKVDTVLPNIAHTSLAKIRNSLIITQNIDNLHERAGSKNIIHVHGDLCSSRCEVCDKVINNYFKYGEKCSCGGRLRNNIILFKEKVRETERIINEIKNSDIFIQIGTSGIIYPAAGYIDQFNFFSNNKLSICIDTKEPENKNKFTYFLKGTATEIVPLLEKIINLK